MFYGESQCSFQTRSGPCKNKVYYKKDGMIGCGVHIKEPRESLPKRSKKEQQKLKQTKFDTHLETIIPQEGPGKLMLTRMYMRKEVPLIPGFLNVYPNYRHQEREDGYGCASLSPMTLGPVPSNPPCLLLENFHSGNKCYADEVDSDGDPTELFFKTQRQFYNDPIPHRHKREKEKPLFSVVLDDKNVPHKLTYIESRYFYCTYYEQLTRKLPDFKELQKLHKEGFNLNICGYDAFPIEDITEAYLNPKHPFGHERVLYALLSGERPWVSRKPF